MLIRTTGIPPQECMAIGTIMALPQSTKVKTGIKARGWLRSGACMPGGSVSRR